MFCTLAKQSQILSAHLKIAKLVKAKRDAAFQVRQKKTYLRQ